VELHYFLCLLSEEVQPPAKRPTSTATGKGHTNDKSPDSPAAPDRTTRQDDLSASQSRFGFKASVLKKVKRPHFRGHSKLSDVARILSRILRRIARTDRRQKAERIRRSAARVEKHRSTSFPVELDGADRRGTVSGAGRSDFEAAGSPDAATGDAFRRRSTDPILPGSDEKSHQDASVTPATTDAAVPPESVRAGVYDDDLSSSEPSLVIDEDCSSDAGQGPIL
jgi:hypothetical protein